MSDTVLRAPSWVSGFALIGLTFVGLYFLPDALRTKTYTAVPSTGATGHADPDFQMNLEFPFVQLNAASGKASVVGKKTFEGLLKASGRKSLLVNLWATWCPPCVEELPSLEYLNRELSKPQNAHFPLLVTVSVDEGTAEIGTLAKTLDFRPTFPILHDPRGEFSSEVGTTRFPETYWISEKGEVLYKWLGPQDWLTQDILDRLSGKH